MDSKYAYAHFTEGIQLEDVNAEGRLVQLNEPIKEGETNLMSASEFQRLKKDFPDRIHGKVIQQEALMDVVNLMYENLKKEIESMPQADERIQRDLEFLKGEFEFNHVLKPDSDDITSVNDVTNKFIQLQNRVRSVQRQNIDSNAVAK